MKKFFVACLVAAMALAVFSCQKERVRTNSDGTQQIVSNDTQSALSGTSWKFTYDQTNYVIIHFTSAGSGYVEVHEDYDTEEWWFSYTYSNGSGSITLSGRDPEYFTVSGNVLTIDGDSFYRI